MDSAMLIRGIPGAEERERNADSFRIGDIRIDPYSFDVPGCPFAATCLGHRWTEGEVGDGGYITKLRPGFYLSDSGRQNNDLIKNWGVAMPRFDDDDDVDEVHLHVNNFARGNMEAEKGLGATLLDPGKYGDWVAKLFVQTAWRLIRPVVRAAESGNMTAISAVTFLAHSTTHALEGIAKKNWGMVNQLSKNRFYWPVLHSEHPELNTRQKDELVAGLHIGGGTGVRVNRARWPDDRLAMLALELIDFIGRQGFDAATSLPALNKETAKSHWWPVVREIFSFSYPDPLGVEEFREMVTYEQDDSSRFKSAFLNALRDKLVSLARR